jgi:hypothetical protein
LGTLVLFALFRDDLEWWGYFGTTKKSLVYGEQGSWLFGYMTLGVPRGGRSSPAQLA